MTPERPGSFPHSLKKGNVRQVPCSAAQGCACADKEDLWASFSGTGLSPGFPLLAGILVPPCCERTGGLDLHRGAACWPCLVLWARTNPIPETRAPPSGPSRRFCDRRRRPDRPDPPLNPRGLRRKTPRVRWTRGLFVGFRRSLDHHVVRAQGLPASSTRARCSRTLAAYTFRVSAMTIRTGVVPGNMLNTSFMCRTAGLSMLGIQIEGSALQQLLPFGAGGGVPPCTAESGYTLSAMTWGAFSSGRRGAPSPPPPGSPSGRRRRRQHRAKQRSSMEAVSSSRVT